MAAEAAAHSWQAQEAGPQPIQQRRQWHGFAGEPRWSQQQQFFDPLRLGVLKFTGQHHGYRTPHRGTDQANGPFWHLLGDGQQMLEHG